MWISYHLSLPPWASGREGTNDLPCVLGVSYSQYRTDEAKTFPINQSINRSNCAHPHTRAAAPNDPVLWTLQRCLDCLSSKPIICSGCIRSARRSALYCTSSRDSLMSKGKPAYSVWCLGLDRALSEDKALLSMASLLMLAFCSEIHPQIKFGIIEFGIIDTSNR